MDKRALLDSCARTGEERLLLGRVWDKYDQCRLKNLPTATAFLSPQEQEAARRLLRAIGAGEEGYAFFGGYEGAERQILCFLPDWAWAVDESQIRAIRYMWHESSASLTHRDFLGSLMAMGVVRETIGDIMVSDQSADILCLQSVADHLLQSYDSAGRTHLRVEETELHNLHIPVAKTKLIRDTVSSLRLDGVVSSGFSISRGKAAEAIAAGRVQLNWSECRKGDKPVAQGDHISLRGLGKCTVEEVGNETKKGRIFVTIKRYL